MVDKSRKAPPPPADATAGAQFVRRYVVRLFDQRNGEGVDWRLVGETLFKAAFEVLDQLPAAQREPMARRVHEGAYRRATGDIEPGQGRGAAGPVAATTADPSRQPPPPQY